jgi:hypothetical protein
MIRKPVSTDGLTSLGAIAKLGYPAEALKRMRILRDEGRAARLQVPPMNHSAKEFVNGMAHANGIERMGGIEARFLRNLSLLQREALAEVY